MYLPLVIVPLPVAHARITEEQPLSLQLCHSGEPEQPETDTVAGQVRPLIWIAVRGTRRSPKDSRLPRFAIAAPSGGSGSPQRTTHTHRILTANRPPSPTCVGTLPSFPSQINNPVFKSLCGTKIPLPDARNLVLCSSVAASLGTSQRKTAFDSPRLWPILAFCGRNDTHNNPRRAGDDHFHFEDNVLRQQEDRHRRF